MHCDGLGKIEVLKNLLLDQLTFALNLNLARVKCLTLLLASLLRHRTVNLAILATENSSGATNQSCYRRFQSFFLTSALPLCAIGGFMLGKIPKPPKGWILAMDRTNWKFGKRHINILTVGIVVNKVAIPIVWKVLPQGTKRGNSNTAQRISLLKKLLKLIDPKDICVLTMDREFGSEKWLRWLDEQKVGYVARIKCNTRVGSKSAQECGTTRGRKGSGRQRIWNMALFFASKRIQSKGRRDSRLYVVSNQFAGKEALALYKMRWGIEQLFSHMKRRGFDFEATHMTDAAKLEKLFALVSLAFLLSFGWGCHLRATRQPTQAMKRKSLFRQGLEDILRLLSKPHPSPAEQREFAAWICLPIYTSFFVV